jgi:hypothetical protein
VAAKGQNTRPGFRTGLYAPLPSYYPRLSPPAVVAIPGSVPPGVTLDGLPLYRDDYGGYRSWYGYPRRWR